MITIRDVAKGEKLILPKRAAHWQGHEDGLLYEYAYVAEHQAGGPKLRIVERYKDIRDFKLQIGAVSRLDCKTEAAPKGDKRTFTRVYRF